MHILFLTDNFPPEANAPASRTHEHCKVWVEAGHAVTVVTCAPNFPKGEVFASYRNAWRQEEMIDGIRVVRVWSSRTLWSERRRRRWPGSTWRRDWRSRRRETAAGA